MYPNAILITGGIGDFLTIESFMNDAQRIAIDSIFYATRAQKPIQEIISVLPNFPNLKNHTVLWDDFSKKFAFDSKNDVVQAVIFKNMKMAEPTARSKISRWNQLLAKVADYSISKIFIEIPNLRPYNNSSFLKYNLANISKFNLPKEYYVICPFSPNDRRNPAREFNHMDWKGLLQILGDFPGVVLNNANDPIPNNNLINLSNQTTFLESIEILKKAKGYFGIDSSLSVLAAKLFDSPNLIIKSQNGHCYANKHIYYAPHKKFKFLQRGIYLPKYSLKN